MNNIILKSVTAAALCSMLLGCITAPGKVSPMPKRQLESSMMPMEFEASNGVKLPFRAYVPECAAYGIKKVPVVMWMHGAGQNGADNTSQLDDGAGCIMSLVCEDSGDYDAVVVAPQCPAGAYWRDEDVLQALNELVQHVIANVRGADPSRVCLIGFSMGGDASWKLALEYPDMPAVIVPICGGPLESMEPDVPDVPDELLEGKVKIWAVNAYDDPIVKTAYAKDFLSQIWRESPRSDTNFTELLSNGHKMSNIVNDRKLLIWMLSAKRKD